MIIILIENFKLNIVIYIKMRSNIGLFLWILLWIANYKIVLIYKNVSICIVVDNFKKNIVRKCINNKIEVLYVSI